MVKKFLLCALILSSLLAACSPTSKPAPTATPADGGAYPYPNTAQVVSPYPGGVEPSVPTDIPAPTPTYDAQMGIVRGRLLEAKAPVKDLIVFLAEIAKDAKGTELAASFSATDSPRMNTTENGEFVFMNVKPGRYSIVLYTGMDAWLLNYPDKKEPILFTVEAGKTVDIGDLNYDDIPLE